MADINEISGVYGGVQLENNQKESNQSNLPVEIGFWAKTKAVLFKEIDWNQEIKVELTPYQQKIEDEINNFLYREITWEKVHDFLFQEISFGKKEN